MSLEATLVAAWAAAYADPVPEGWDFSEFEESVQDQEPSWSWSALARGTANGVSSMLDLETGGGEAPLEIVDVLRHGDTFLTQQVDGHDLDDLADLVR